MLRRGQLRAWTVCGATALAIATVHCQRDGASGEPEPAPTNPARSASPGAARPGVPADAVPLDDRPVTDWDPWGPHAQVVSVVASFAASHGEVNWLVSPVMLNEAGNAARIELFGTLPRYSFVVVTYQTDE